MTRRLIGDTVRPRVRPELTTLLATLTDRECEVRSGIAAGLSKPELAHHLILGEATVKTHVSRVLPKLNLRDRVQAAAFAYESGLVRPGGQPSPLG